MIDFWDITIPELSGDTPRRSYCYVPDSWQEDRSLRFPVLYMFDGHNVFFDEHATYGKSWGMLDYLEKTHIPLIVAAVECNHDPDHGRLHEYSPFACQVDDLGCKLKGKGKDTMAWWVDKYKPFIDHYFPTLPDREHTFIAGSSMGGLMSLYAVTKYNKVFSRAAALSPSIWFAEENLEKLLRTARMKRDTVIYMDYGANELGFHPNMRKQFAAVTSILLERGINLTSRIVPDGDHTEASWEKQIPIFMEQLFYGLEL